MKVVVKYKPLKRTPKQREAAEKLEDCLYRLALKKWQEMNKTERAKLILAGEV